MRPPGGRTGPTAGETGPPVAVGRAGQPTGNAQTIAFPTPAMHLKNNTGWQIDGWDLGSDAVRVATHTAAKRASALARKGYGPFSDAVGIRKDPAPGSRPLPFHLSCAPLGSSQQPANLRSSEGKTSRQNPSLRKVSADPEALLGCDT